MYEMMFYKFLLWIDRQIWNRQLDEYRFFEIVWLLTIGLFILVPISYLGNFLEWLNKTAKVGKKK